MILKPHSMEFKRLPGRVRYRLGCEGVRQTHGLRSPAAVQSSSPGAFVGPSSSRQKVPDRFLPLRWAGANPLKSSPAGVEKVAASVPFLFGIFIAPRGASAAVQARSGMCVNTSVFTFIYLFLSWEETVIFNTIAKQVEEG